MFRSNCQGWIPKFSLSWTCDVQVIIQSKCPKSFLLVLCSCKCMQFCVDYQTAAWIIYRVSLKQVSIKIFDSGLFSTLIRSVLGPGYTDTFSNHSVFILLRVSYRHFGLGIFKCLRFHDRFHRFRVNRKWNCNGIVAFPNENVSVYPGFNFSISCGSVIYIIILTCLRKI